MPSRSATAGLPVERLSRLERKSDLAVLSDGLIEAAQLTVGATNFSSFAYRAPNVAPARQPLAEVRFDDQWRWGDTIW